MIDLLNLTSGLIGALIGSVIGAAATYKAAIKGAKVSIEGSAKLDLERRGRETDELKNQVINHLISEIEDNIELSENVKIHYAKIRFLSEAYEMAKLHARVLSPTILELLRPAYVEIARYNILADYDQDKVSFGAGYLDDDLAKQAEKVKDRLSELPGKLREFLET